MELLPQTWSDFKSIISSKTLLMQYYEYTRNYLIWAEDGCVCFSYIIWKSGSEPVDSDTSQIATDRTDFKNNYKNAINKKIGGHGKTSIPTAVSDGNRVNPLYDKIGKTVVSVGQIRELKTSNTLTLTDTAETTLLSAGGSGVFLDLLMLIVTNTSVTSTRVDFRDSTGGTVRFSLIIPATTSLIVPLEGTLPQTTANNNWTAQLSAAATDIRITVTADKNI